MSEKHKKHQDPQQARSFQLERRHIFAGAAVLLVSAAIAVAVTTLLGFASNKDAKSGTTPGVPGVTGVLPPTPIAPATPGERSAAADVLDTKSWADMSQEERDLVRSEVTRVFDNGTFRAYGSLLLAIDIFRRDGQTHVSRQYDLLATPTPNRKFIESTIFYCPGTAGAVDAYKYRFGATDVEVSRAAAPKGAEPWQRIIGGLDWTNVKDAGWKAVEGRRVHGLDLPLGISSGALPSRYWFDVENGRLLQREEFGSGYDSSPTNSYTLDWGELPPPAVPEGYKIPPCLSQIVAALAKPSL